MHTTRNTHAVLLAFMCLTNISDKYPCYRPCMDAVLNFTNLRNPKKTEFHFTSTLPIFFLLFCPFVWCNPKTGVTLTAYLQVSWMHSLLIQGAAAMKFCRQIFLSYPLHCIFVEETCPPKDPKLTCQIHEEQSAVCPLNRNQKEKRTTYQITRL